METKDVEKKPSGKDDGREADGAPGNPSECRQERQCLEALQRLDILDSPPEQRFDRITRVAAHLFDVPLAHLFFIDAGRLWAKASYGMEREAASGPREGVWFADTLLSPRFEVIEDAAEDARYAERPYVTGSPYLRFCAAAPLTAEGGEHLGSLCVCGSEPRRMSAEERGLLEDLAAAVMDQLKMGQSLHEAQEAEEALHASEEKYARLFETANDAILVFEPEEEIILEVNAKAAEIYGFSQSELIGRSLKTLTQDVPRGEREVRRSLETGRIQGMETRHRRKDGTLINVLVNASVVTYEGRTAILSFHRDITERKRAQARTRQLKSFYENILDEVPVEIVVLDAEARYRYLNATAIPDPELRRWMRGKTDIDFARRRNLDIGQYRERRDWILGLIERKEAGQYLETTTGADGDTKHMMRHVSPVLDEKGAVKYVIGYTVDLTERRKHEEHLRRAKEKAEQASRVKDAIINNMSHEVRTPLASMIGFAEVLADDLKEDHEEQAEFAHIIRRSGERLQHTLESVLVLAQLEAGRYKLEQSPVDVKTLAEWVVNLYQPQAQEQDLRLEVEHEAGSLHALADETALDRVLTNLVSNALKFTREGTVTIRLGCRSAGDAPPGELVSGCLDEAADYVVLQVKDTGIGISKGFIPDLFKAFEQESSGLVREHQGAGLGLSITQRLVDLMNGAVYLESEKNVGTTVTVCLQTAEA